MVQDGYFTSIEISPDSSWVVYSASQDVYLTIELYSVPIDGPSSASGKLNTSIVAEGDVHEFRISSDSQYVVYKADLRTNDVIEIFSVPIGGPPAESARLNLAYATGGTATHFRISPDGERVAYFEVPGAPTHYDLYSVPISGPASSRIQLNPVSPALDIAYYPEIAPDGQRVVYLAERGGSGVREVFSVPIDGPAADTVKLNGDLGAEGDVGTVRISPDGQRVAYVADPEYLFFNDVFRLYSVPVTGPPTIVSLNLLHGIEGGFLDVMGNFRFTPDGRRVIYMGDQAVDDVFEVYAVQAGGPATGRLRLNGPLPAEGDVDQFAAASDSEHIVYIADQDTNDVDELYVSIIRPARARRWTGYE
jgi:Tol biopolymer transport system component